MVIQVQMVYSDEMYKAPVCKAKKFVELAYRSYHKTSLLLTKVIGFVQLTIVVILHTNPMLDLCAPP